MVTDVKEGKVSIDYKDEGVHAVPLKTSEVEGICNFCNFFTML